jgi:branched-chain amino acid transport system ATP-binding protein
VILELSDVNAYYGTSHILFDVSLKVAEGEAICLLGRNGAGKSTTLRSIIGLTPPRSGRIWFQGKEISGMSVHSIARLGIGYVPDDRRVFPNLTVRQNLEIAMRNNRKGGRDWTVERVYSLFPGLEKLDSNKGSYLSGGEQQMLTMGRSLMGNPSFLLLDEPAEGLSPLVVRTLKEQIQKLKEEGLTILLSEQNVPFAMELSERVYVIDKGRIRYQGSIAELKENEEIRKRYLLV